MKPKAKVKPYDGPAGGWGSVNAVASILTQEEVAVLGSEILLKQNKPGRLHVRELLLGEAGRAASLRVLRERRQGHGVGDHRARRSRRSSSRKHTLDRAAHLVRLTSWKSRAG